MKTAVITGATSGIGLAVAKKLLQMGYRLIGVGRSESNSQKALDMLKVLYPESQMIYFSGDLIQQREIRRVAEQINEYLDTHCDGMLDVLINNAGAVRTWYTTTEEGYEQQFALNHLASFLLTHYLMPALSKAKGKMILTGSGSHKHYTIRWDDMMYQKRRYSCLMAYKQSKLCNLLFAREFNRRFLQSGVRAYVVDPGLVNTDIGAKQTGGIVSAFWSLRKKHGVMPEVAAETYGFLCTAPLEEYGLYFLQSKKAPYDRRVDRIGDAERLFAYSQALCGIEKYGGEAI